MEVIDVEGRPPASGTDTVLAIGKFDGVHLGHQAILQNARSHAVGATLAVMTFWPHPAFVLTGQEAYRRCLTPFAEQVRQFSALGVERVYRVHFTPAFAATPADVFVRDHLGHLRLRHVVVGEDFRFGHGGRSTVEDLGRLCAQMGVPVSVVSSVEESGTKISSSRIREHLAAGRVEAAEALLGRPYSISGIVEHGDARGRLLGFPTANLGDIDDYVLPASGVYAVAVALEERGESKENWFGVANAGWRPTVDGSSFRLEVHLLDFAGDLYGRRLRVSFLRRVRDEQKFSGLEELKRQIEHDVKWVRDMFGR